MVKSSSSLNNALASGRVTTLYNNKNIMTSYNVGQNVFYVFINMYLFTKYTKLAKEIKFNILNSDIKILM